MNNKTKVEIIIPFIDSQKKGDIRYMKPNSAITYEKEGLVKIVENKKKVSPATPSKKKKVSPVIPQKNEIDSFMNDFFSKFKIYHVVESKEILYYLDNKINNSLQAKSKSSMHEDLELYFMGYAKSKGILINSIFERFSEPMNLDPDKTPLSKFLKSYIKYYSKINIINNIRFEPQETRYIKEDSKIYLNTYQPTKYLKKSFNNGCKDESKFKNIKELIMNLCDNDKKSYDYFLKVLSHSITNPMVKRQGYLLFKGDGASGKGTFFDLILTPIFDKYFISGTYEDTLGNDYNSHLVECIWCIVEEKEGNKKQLDNINSLIKVATGTSTMVRKQKYIDNTFEKCFQNYGMTTNKYNPGLNLDHNDRRLSVLGHSKTLGGSHTEATEKRALYEIEIPKELDFFVSYLKNLEFKHTEIFSPLQNNQRTELIMLDYSNAQKFFYYIRKELEITSANELLKQTELVIHGIKKENSEEVINYIPLDRILEEFYLYCDNNGGLNKTSPGKFMADFYHTTGISKAVRKTYNKKQSRYILYDEFKNYFFNEVQE